MSAGSPLTPYGEALAAPRLGESPPAALPERLHFDGEWIFGPGGTDFVAKTSHGVLAAELVRRYNAHEALVTAARQASDWIDRYRRAVIEGRVPAWDGAADYAPAEALRRALSAAEGGAR